MAPSSSGLGPDVFSVVIRGSNPLGVTKVFVILPIALLLVITYNG